MPSQISGVGPTAPWQIFVPLWHTNVPARHWPTQFDKRPPGHSVAHVPPTSTGLSSTIPLQLSSTPLHTSALGPTVCAHVKPFGPGPGAPVHTYAARHAPVV